MPPKPRPLRKPSISQKNGPPVPSGSKPVGLKPAETDKTAKDGAMLPPPAPGLPRGVLEPEVDALGASLRAAAVKTGQIYGFHADTRRLGLNRYLPYPPRALTASLGREVEKYDQLCDAIEYQLHRAIAVLQRDLQREEQRLKAQEEAVASRTRSKTPSSSPNTARIPLPGSAPTSPSIPLSSLLPTEGSPPLGQSSQTSPPLPPQRRQSVIQLSSLSRPFPHKLDLSASAMRIGTDEFAHGLASPVTLAPKSARPIANGELDLEIPPEIMAMALATGPPGPQGLGMDLQGSGMDAQSLGMNPQGMGMDTQGMGPPPPPGHGHVDIDLTLTDSQGDMHLDVGGLGSSADKPIDLDLDMDINMSELFGNGSAQAQGAGPSGAGVGLGGHGGAQVPVGDLFGGVGTPGGSAGAQKKPDGAVDASDLGMGGLLDLSAGVHAEDIFAAFTSGTGAPDATPQQAQNTPSGADGAGSAAAAILANFSAATGNVPSNGNGSGTTPAPPPGAEGQEAIDLTGMDLGFFGSTSDAAYMSMDDVHMDDFLTISAVPMGQTGSPAKGTSS